MSSPVFAAWTSLSNPKNSGPTPTTPPHGPYWLLPHLAVQIVAPKNTMNSGTRGQMGQNRLHFPKSPHFTIIGCPTFQPPIKHKGSSCSGHHCCCRRGKAARLHLAWKSVQTSGNGGARNDIHPKGFWWWVSVLSFWGLYTRNYIFSWILTAWMLSSDDLTMNDDPNTGRGSFEQFQNYQMVYDSED